MSKRRDWSKFENYQLTQYHQRACKLKVRKEILSRSPAALNLTVCKQRYSQKCQYKYKQGSINVFTYTVV